MTALNRAAWVHLTFCLQVSLMRNLGCFEGSKSYSFSVGSNAGAPFFLVLGHTQQSTRLIRYWSPLDILSINGTRNVAQVLHSVVQAVAVYVVNVAFRPSPIYIKPSKTMRRVCDTIHTHDPVVWTVLLKGAPLLPLVEASEQSSFRVVFKQFAQALRGKIVSSHDALQLLIGQRPACVRAHGGLRYFSVL